MKLITWNVNSIRVRMERLAALLERHRPDVVCLQELKVTDDVFPAAAIEALGYRCAVYGQKAYNGVAILSRGEPADVSRGLCDAVPDPHSRLIAATIDGVRIISAYFPNGSFVGSEKYQYKIEWMHRLRTHLEQCYQPDQPLVLCGDLNVAVDDKDVANPELWASSVLCHPTARAALREIADWGLVDVFAKMHPEGGIYSWWDYQLLSFPKNNGLRIDHVLATRPLADKTVAAEVDRNERKGKSPSDHAPVIVTFE
ncbi:MAG: exodeoxyribonuclease III [Planctomycetaceae bacterium]|nr:exodeoxyribonuclease III [Planctomycetaceae bacterium]